MSSKAQVRTVFVFDSESTTEIAEGEIVEGGARFSMNFDDVLSVDELTAFRDFVTRLIDGVSVCAKGATS